MALPNARVFYFKNKTLVELRDPKPEFPQEEFYCYLFKRDGSDCEFVGMMTAEKVLSEPGRDLNLEGSLHPGLATAIRQLQREAFP